MRPVVSLGLVLVALGAVVSGGRSARAQVAQVDVFLTEYAIAANPSSVPEGSVEFQVRNDGPLTVHNLRVIRTDLPPDGLPTIGLIVDESQLDVVAGTSDLSVNASVNVTADLTAGRYVLICNVVGHYQLGMYAPFTVQGQQAPTATSTLDGGGAIPTPTATVGPTTAPSATPTVGARPSPSAGVTPTATVRVTGVPSTGQGPDQGAPLPRELTAFLAAGGAALAGLGALVARRRGGRA